ncbi:MAG TPA: 50S ribosomal protein L22 [Candidatus Polarisedimenticolia bacterium]|nr:50S ribosomal protein L22 [Candidatus Polarisedimenticolia bacterium]
MAVQIRQVASARLKYLGTSAQKVRLVVDLIRGKPVEEALAILRFTKKAVAPEIGALVDSAIANARQKQQDIDVDQLFVRTVSVDGGPSLKRIRPAPMGRAFRVMKRMSHVTIGLGQRLPDEPVAREDAQTGGAGRGTAGGGVRRGTGAAPAARSTKGAGEARKGAPAKKKKATRSTAAAKKKSRS